MSIAWQTPEVSSGPVFSYDMIHRRLLIGQDGRLDQLEAYDLSQLVREYGPCVGLTLSVQG